MFKSGIAVLILGCLTACAGPVSEPASTLDPAMFNGTIPAGFGEVTFVTLEPGTYPVSTQDDLVVAGGQYPVRRVTDDRVRIGFSGMVTLQPDGTELFEEVRAFTTEPSIRVGGTERKLEAVLVVQAFCNFPRPDADSLYGWGDEPVMRAEDTGEFQFTNFC